MALSYKTFSVLKHSFRAAIALKSYKINGERRHQINDSKSSNYDFTTLLKF